MVIEAVAPKENSNCRRSACCEALPGYPSLVFLTPTPRMLALFAFDGTITTRVHRPSCPLTTTDWAGPPVDCPPDQQSDDQGRARGGIPHVPGRLSPPHLLLSPSGVKGSAYRGLPGQRPANPPPPCSVVVAGPLRFFSSPWLAGLRGGVLLGLSCLLCCVSLSASCEVFSK